MRVAGSAMRQTCSVLSLTEGNQRVLLHRGRSRLRQLFEDEFREEFTDLYRQWRSEQQ
jgi:hypothetical protein